MEQAPDLIIPLPITPLYLWIAWIILVVIFITISWILNHHWNYYGAKSNNKVFARSLYFVGGIAMLIIMALLIGGYSVIK